jgi:hypothetical protein
VIRAEKVFSCSLVFENITGQQGQGDGAEEISPCGRDDTGVVAILVEGRTTPVISTSGRNLLSGLKSVFLSHFQ